MLFRCIAIPVSGLKWPSAGKVANNILVPGFKMDEETVSAIDAKFVFMIIYLRDIRIQDYFYRIRQ
jgi:hypothetical protein